MRTVHRGAQTRITGIGAPQPSHRCGARMWLPNLPIFQEKLQLQTLTWNFLILKCQLVIHTLESTRQVKGVAANRACLQHAGCELRAAEGEVHGGVTVGERRVCLSSGVRWKAHADGHFLGSVSGCTANSVRWLSKPATRFFLFLSLFRLQLLRLLPLPKTGAAILL